MEDLGIFRYVLPAVGGGLGVFLLINSARNAPNSNKCDFGLGPLLFLLLGTVIFTYGAFALFFDNLPDDNFNDDVWLKPFFVLASIVFIGFTLDSWKRKILWGDDGLVIKRLLRPEISASWNEIQSLTYNDWAQWWNLKFNDGRSIVFYDMMRGSKHLIDECSRRISS